MTSTIAIYALLHAVPILLTAYISRSKSSVRTAAVIMAFVAFLGGAFQYVLVDLFVVFVAYVYSFDKWCVGNATTHQDSGPEIRSRDFKPPARRDSTRLPESPSLLQDGGAGRVEKRISEEDQSGHQTEQIEVTGIPPASDTTGWDEYEEFMRDVRIKNTTGTKEAALDIAVNELKRQIQWALIDDYGDERRLTSNWSRGYIFGFCDRIFQSAGASDRKERSVLLTKSHEKLFGSKIGSEILQVSLQNQIVDVVLMPEDGVFANGVRRGQFDVFAFVEHGEEPTGLTEYLLTGNLGEQQ